MIQKREVVEKRWCRLIFVFPKLCSKDRKKPSDSAALLENKSGNHAKERI